MMPSEPIPGFVKPVVGDRHNCRPRQQAVHGDVAIPTALVMLVVDEPAQHSRYHVNSSVMYCMSLASFFGAVAHEDVLLSSLPVDADRLASEFSAIGLRSTVSTTGIGQNWPVGYHMARPIRIGALPGQKATDDWIRCQPINDSGTARGEAVPPRFQPQASGLGPRSRAIGRKND